MYYRAVGNRCAIDLSSIPIPEDRAHALLSQLGFRILSVDAVTLARERVGQSRYWRGVSYSEAPRTVDCSAFIKWIYGQKGIWIPRLSVQQHSYGEAVHFSDLKAGDAVFTPGCTNFYLTNPEEGVGHVGLVTDTNTVIHAAGQRSGVVETSLERFLKNRELRGIRRFSGEKTITIEIPATFSVEWSDDLKWILLRSLDKADRPS